MNHIFSKAPAVEIKAGYLCQALKEGTVIQSGIVISCVPAELMDIYAHDIIQPSHCLQSLINMPPEDPHPLFVDYDLLWACGMPLGGNSRILPPHLQDPCIDCSRRGIHRHNAFIFEGQVRCILN